MRFLRRAVLLFIAATLLLTAGGCVQTPAVNQEDSVLRVGISTNAPPFAFRQGGKTTGIEPALATRLGNYLGKKIELVPVSWDEQIDYLNTGKTDIIMSGMTITEQRSFLVDFTIPYMRSGQIMLVRLEDRQRFATGVESLLNTNYRIGTVADTVSDFFVTATINQANEIVFKTSQDAVNALIDQKIDVFVYDAPVICYYAARHQQDKLVPVLAMATEEYIGWAVRKSEPEFLSQVNQFVQSLKQQGALQEELAYWIPYLYR
jgi:polar amino acid transport system substrate-binding protein